MKNAQSLTDMTIGELAKALKESPHLKGIRAERIWKSFVKECKYWYYLDPDEIMGSNMRAEDPWFSEDYLAPAEGRKTRIIP